MLDPHSGSPNVKDSHAFRFASYTNEPQERWDGISHALGEIHLIFSTSIQLFKAS